MWNKYSHFRPSLRWALFPNPFYERFGFKISCNFFDIPIQGFEMDGCKTCEKSALLVGDRNNVVEEYACLWYSNGARVLPSCGWKKQCCWGICLCCEIAMEQEHCHHGGGLVVSWVSRYGAPGSMGVESGHNLVVVSCWGISLTLHLPSDNLCMQEWSDVWNRGCLAN